MPFIKRITAPDHGDRNYTAIPYGGRNSADAKDDTGYVLPSQVAWCRGRMLENWNSDRVPEFSVNNWWQYTDYNKTQEPCEGAIVIYHGRNIGRSGLVFVIEDIDPITKDLLCSYSSPQIMSLETLHYPYTTYSYDGYNYSLDGFIYDTWVEPPVPPTPTRKKTTWNWAISNNRRKRIMSLQKPNKII